MDFLYPIYVAGVLTAVIPVLIHLLTKRQKRHILFSDLTLLRKVDAEEAPRYRWENLLLLLLRVFVFALLALLFCQPVWKEGKSLLRRPGRGTAVALVIDASRSMDASVGGVARYEKAKQMALQVLDNLRGEDEAMAVFASSHTRTSHASPTPFREEVRESVEQSRVSPYASSFVSEVHLAVDALVKSPLTNREIYLFTDCQANGMSPAPPSWPEGCNQITGYFAYLPESGSLPTVEVTDLQVSPLAAKPGDPLAIKANVVAHGDEAARSVEMNFETGPNNRLYRKISVVPGEPNPVEFGLSRSSEPVDFGSIVIQADILGSDNSVFYALPEIRPFRIVMTRGGGSDQSLLFLQVALRLLAQLPLIPAIEARYVELGKLPEALSGETVDVVIVANPARLSRTWVQAVSGWVREGGNLILATGSRDEGDVNELTVPQWFPVEIKPWEVSQEDSTSPTSFDFHNSWMDRFENQEEADWQSVKVWGGYEFKEDPKTGADFRALMTLERGSPLLWQREIGLGTLSVWMSSLDARWNDVPRSGLFVALWGEFLRSLAEKKGLSPYFTAGGQVPIEVIRKDDRPTEIRVKSPDGREHVLALAGLRLTQNLYFSRSEDVGVYSVDYDEDRVERVTPTAFAVNVEPGEADLTALPAEEVESLFPFPIQRVDNRETMAAQIGFIRYGHGLWPLVLVCVICLLVTEAWMGRPR